MYVASWCCMCVCVVPCVSFCTGHFVMVPLNMTYLHCLQHSLFEHLSNLYWHVYIVYNILSLNISSIYILTNCLTADDSILLTVHSIDKRLIYTCTWYLSFRKSSTFIRSSVHFCNNHFVLVPINLTRLHCLQHPYWLAVHGKPVLFWKGISGLKFPCFLFYACYLPEWRWEPFEFRAIPILLRNLPNIW